jgi:hypothetical protein
MHHYILKHNEGLLGSGNQISSDRIYYNIIESEENATFGNFFVSVSMKYHEMSTNGVTGKTAALTVTPSGLLDSGQLQNML